jgi:hypothetical protein
MQNFRGKNIISKKFKVVFVKLQGPNIIKIKQRGFSKKLPGPRIF